MDSKAVIEPGQGVGVKHLCQHVILGDACGAPVAVGAYGGVACKVDAQLGGRLEHLRDREGRHLKGGGREHLPVL